jgi:hypothetical protein
MLLANTIDSAEIPRMINYQARLTDTDSGEPLQGSYDLEFRLYDSATEGSLLWSETQSVEIDSLGIVSVILGSQTEIDIPFDRPVWLEVVVEGGILSPRRELASVPYAFRAKRSDDADSLGGVPSGDYVVQGVSGVVTTDMISDGPGSGLDADMLDGLDSDAFADSGHSHDERYYKQDSLNTAGVINDTANPVDWTKLKGVPPGIADGTDDVGPGDGHSLDADDGSPVDALYVDHGGNVGIGTTTPTNGQLEVMTATGVGIYSESSDDAAVIGSRGTVDVVRTPSGVVGIGEDGSGLAAYSESAAHPALYAEHLAGAWAILAKCDIASYSTFASAIWAIDSGVGAGLFGQSQRGEGVRGRANTYDGIGTSGYGPGYDVNDFPGSFYRPGGFFAGRNGVIGYTEETNGTSVIGYTTNPTCWAGSFISSGHGVNIIAAAGKTGLSVSGGSKSAVVETASGPRQLYCEESSEVWFTDYGFGQMEDGTALVQIDPVFAQTVNLDEPYHVFIQVYGNAEVYVAERTQEAFEVRLRDGDVKAEFSYRIVAKRKGFEDSRLARFQGIAVIQQTNTQDE